MIKTQFLSIEEVLSLHTRTIKVHDGRPGTRDLGLLESAILRCQSGYYSTLAEQAASLLQNLCMNHCFIDGNKRVALLATVIFLKMNNYNLKCHNKTIVNFIVKKVITQKLDVKDIAEWIGPRLVKR